MSVKYCLYCQDWKRGACLSCPDRHEDEREWRIGMTNGEKFKTAEERAKAFTKWCEEKQKTAIGKVAKHECSDCPLDERTPCCFFFWLDLEAEEEKPLPCPFCGREVSVHTDAPEEWVSCECGYSSKMMNHGCSIAAHNRVARAMLAAKEDGSGNY